MPRGGLGWWAGGGRVGALAALLLLGLVAQAGASDLVIWWNAGASPEPDRRLEAIARDYAETAAQEVELAFYTTEDLPARLEAALEAGAPPDLAMGHDLDLWHVPLWAAEGRLADVTQTIEAIGGDAFDPSALRSVLLENAGTGERAYYAFPVHQATGHLHYWRSFLELAGFDRAAIPVGWDAFWPFWCKQAQPEARDATENLRLYGIGQPVSAQASETRFNLLQFLIARGGEIIGGDGDVVIGSPRNRRALVEAIRDYSTTYVTGCSPPGSIQWRDGDNADRFLARRTMLTIGPALGVPVALREADPEAYRDDLMTLPWPDAPAGGPIPLVLRVGAAVIFEAAANVDNARAFMAHLLRPEAIGSYLEAARGRWYPTLGAAQARPFWSESDDPHRAALVRQMREQPKWRAPAIRNWRYARVEALGILQQGLAKVVIDAGPPEAAADWIIERIEAIVGDAG